MRGEARHLLLGVLKHTAHQGEVHPISRARSKPKETANRGLFRFHIALFLPQSEVIRNGTE